jgi:hypothetical protein
MEPGIAASGINIASLALQVGDCIMKLKTFCDAVKNAPEEIGHLIEETGTLSLVLSEFEARSTIRQESRPKCLLFCQKAASILSALVKDIEAKITKRNRIASVKAVLKRDGVEKLRGG